MKEKELGYSGALIELGIRGAQVEKVVGLTDDGVHEGLLGELRTGSRGSLKVCVEFSLLRRSIAPSTCDPPKEGGLALGNHLASGARYKG